MTKISKTKINHYLKHNPIIDASEIVNHDNSITLTINLGEEMPRNDNMSLILKELKTINSRLDNIETDVSSLRTDVDFLKTEVSSLKVDVASLKVEAKRHGWNIE